MKRKGQRMKPEGLLTLEPAVTSFLCGASFCLHPGGGAGALRAFPCGQPSACLPKEEVQEVKEEMRDSWLLLLGLLNQSFLKDHSFAIHYLNKDVTICEQGKKTGKELGL